MSHVRLVMCHVDEADATDAAMTELACVDLPVVRVEIGVTLDTLETQVATMAGNNDCSILGPFGTSTVQIT